MGMGQIGWGGLGGRLDDGVAEERAGRARG